MCQHCSVWFFGNEDDRSLELAKDVKEPTARGRNVERAAV